VYAVVDLRKCVDLRRRHNAEVMSGSFQTP
jgi:hypothetical protein